MDGSDPLIYIIIFAILFFVALFILTWVLDQYFKAYNCSLAPNIWCSDTFSCNNTCTGSVSPSGDPVSPCFAQDFTTGTTGLASCLFGPEAEGATLCFNSPTGSNPSALACECIETMNNIPNCLSNCSQFIDQLPPDSPCCNINSCFAQ